MFENVDDLFIYIYYAGMLALVVGIFVDSNMYYEYLT